MQKNNGMDATSSSNSGGDNRNINSTFTSLDLTKFIPKEELPKHAIKIACDHAPDKVQSLINTLDNNRPLLETQKKYLFTGNPGTGKTTLAQAIAQRFKWECIFVHVSELPNQYQNSAASGLKEIIDAVLAESEAVTIKKYLILLDEMTHLTNNYKEKNNANNDAARPIASLLDRCSTNPNILVIGTTNDDASELPHLLQDRFSDNIIKINLPSSKARKEYLTIQLTGLDESYINFLVKKTNGKSFRIINSLFGPAKEKANIENRTITKEDIDAIISQLKPWWHPAELYGSYTPFLKNHVTLSNIAILVGLCTGIGQTGQIIYSRYDTEKQRKIQYNLEQQQKDFQEKQLSLQQSSHDLQQNLSKEQKLHWGWKTYYVAKDVVSIGATIYSLCKGNSEIKILTLNPNADFQTIAKK